jgi:Tol biopolymer transport system component
MTELREQVVDALGDRYVIEREIGAGGMATVYLARDVKHDRQVALKILDPELAAVMGVERFLAEIRVSANLQHPNLLPLFDSGEAPNGSLYYVMPYVEGETLRHRLTREKQLPVDDALRITTAIASALDYAHRHGVIHRDLKPENVLFHEGQPVVADFGIALAAAHAGGHRITQTGVSLGTPSYMSPEQATGDRTIDARTDIYSLGAMLYEMLTGEPPHTGMTAQAIIARVLTEKPRDIRTVRPAVPLHVEAAVERALEKLPADRWETAGAFCDALTGKSPTLAERAPRFARPRDLLAPIPLVLAGITLASIAFAITEWRAAHNVEPPTPVRVTLQWADPNRSGVAPAPAISPDGKTIAYAGFAPNGLAMMFIRTLSELRPRVLPGTESGLQAAFSPDGQWLGFYALGAIKKVHLGTGTVRTLANIDLPEGVDWGPDDRIVASVWNSLWSISATGGAAQPLTRLDTANGELAQRGPHFLEDGQSLVFYSWRGTMEGSKVGIVSLKTGATRYVDIAGAPVGVIDGLLIYVAERQSLFAVPFDASRARVTGAPIRLPDIVPIVGNGIGRATISRSGSLLYASGSALGDLVLVDTKGKIDAVLATAQTYSFPRFSPDGKRIAVSIGSPTSTDVWIYDLSSNTHTRITMEGARNDRVEWAPDGKRILYSSVGRAGITALWIQNVDHSGTPELLEARKNEQILEGLISPDGTTLVFRATALGHPHDIWYRQLTGDTTRKAVVSAPSSEYAPRLSPNGKWIAYSSNEDGTSQIYVQPFPPTGAHYPVTDAGGIMPVWSPDGRHIYYIAAGTMLAATIETAPNFRVLARDSVFSVQPYNLAGGVHAAYDVSPDGKHLLLIRPARAENDLVLVHNWLTEVRRLRKGE